MEFKTGKEDTWVPPTTPTSFFSYTDAVPSLSPFPSPHSAKVCEEKLRYAAYNCVAIDTDMSPWEE